MQLLDGKLVSFLIKEDIKNQIDLIIKNRLRKPQLATIISSDNEESRVYVSSKHKTANSLGFLTKDFVFDNHNEQNQKTIQNKLIDLIITLNNDKNIDAILVQLPLFPFLNTKEIINTISPLKDVDGITEQNLGALMNGNPLVCPCTPLGILKLLEYYKINLQGKKVAVIGRSMIVGRPLSILLNNKGVDATVIMCNSYTKDLKEITKSSDIVISAIGSPHFLTKDYFNSSSIVIDVGITRIKEGDKVKLQGDVDFDNVKDYVKAITPVPGGVGPLTIASLMFNTLKLYKIHEGINE